MNKLFLTLAIVTLILLFPVPIKLQLFYKDKLFIAKLYNKTIFPYKKKNILKNKKRTGSKENKSKKKSFNFSKGKVVISTLMKNKYKFKLELYIKVDYGFEDACNTAVSYGIFHQLLSNLFIPLKSIFIVDSYKYHINMEYNKNILNFEIKSIIFINLAKIIYIAVKIIYNLWLFNKISNRKNENFKEEFNNG